jgi:hypothetical protein
MIAPVRHRTILATSDSCGSISYPCRDSEFGGYFIEQGRSS